MGTAADRVEDTFLTERQIEVLSLRLDGLTQSAIADRLGTSVANVSSVESAARRNIDRARRTVDLARLLRCIIEVDVAEGDDLRDVLDRVYAAGDDAGVTVEYTEPELSGYLLDALGDRIHGRRFTSAATIGIAPDGDVEPYPAAGD